MTQMEMITLYVGNVCVTVGVESLNQPPDSKQSMQLSNTKQVSMLTIDTLINSMFKNVQRFNF